jgi:hypothetical protein
MLMLRLLLRWNWEQQQVVAQRPGRGRHQPFRSAIGGGFLPPCRKLVQDVNCP